tara:strand:+ start:3248 stop:4306 length:1059 start_codon:yes stop_codon:yes gene_type:complete
MTFTIAHINTSRGFRGGERQTELLIEGLQGSGYKQILIARKNRQLARRVKKNVDVEVREVSSGHLSVALACSNADILHVHDGRSVYGAYLNSLISRTPYIITRRVDNPISNHWFSRQAYRSASTIAAVAKQVANIIKQFDPSLKPKVVHSGSSNLITNETNIKKILSDYPKNSFLVGHVGALDNNQKGQEFIIEVARDLQISHPDIHFLLVGGGDDEAMLKKMAAGVSNLKFIGFVNNVGDYLAVFNIFILPSRKEGIGSILLDAMAMKLPVIACEVGGVPDIVHNNLNGYLIESERPDLLKEAILSLYNQPQLCAEFSKRGSEIAVDYTADIMCKKYLKIYQSILQDSNKT